MRSILRIALVAGPALVGVGVFVHPSPVSAQATNFRQEYQDIKNGMTVPPEWSLSKLFDFATKPAWVSGILRGKRRTFGNLAGHLKGTEDITALSVWINSQFDTTLSWKDIDWVRSMGSPESDSPADVPPRDCWAWPTERAPGLASRTFS